jgi:hypothetical protein
MSLLSWGNVCDGMHRCSALGIWYWLCFGSQLPLFLCTSSDNLIVLFTLTVSDEFIIIKKMDHHKGQL